jgi:hypothetical protein
MKMQIPLRHILAAAVGTVISAAGLSCDQGPVDYGKFEQRTIEANLAVVDSAATIYHAQFAAGNIDAAAAQAQAFLLTQPGVDTAMISPDSTVWAFFTSGLLAGTGDVRRDTTGSGAAGPEREPTVRASGGGETGEYTHYVLPHNTELPGTQKAADAIRGIFERKLGWDDDKMYKGGEVDLGLVLGLINPGTSVLFWSGHGTVVPESATALYGVSSLVLGKNYDTKKMAEATAKQYAGYLNPAPGQRRQVAVFEDEKTHKFYHVVMPEFIRANGDFDGAESLPINRTKTIVYLSCCYSSTYGLPSAFIDAGADVVYGYSREVSDGWSCSKDTAIFSALADTCMAKETYYVGESRDPKTWAELGRFGDSLVMLRALCRVKRGDDTLRAQFVQAVRNSSGSGISALLYPEPSSDPAANVMISFPGDQPGLFNCTADENATIYWTDAGTGRTYTVMKDFVGVNGTIDVGRCRSDVMTGHFSGKLGWWDFGKDPEKEPPTDTIGLRDGIFKFTGKVGSGKLSPQRLAAGMPPTAR